MVILYSLDRLQPQATRHTQTTAKIEEEITVILYYRAVGRVEGGRGVQLKPLSKLMTVIHDCCCMPRHYGKLIFDGRNILEVLYF